MLTPSFKLQQNDEFLLLEIHAPYIKANDLEIYIDGCEFKFYVKPYFLRLNFQNEIVEDGRETASYDISKGIFNISIPKKNMDEYFEDLDMLTTLLAPKSTKTSVKPLIEELPSLNNDDDSNDCDDKTQEKEEEEKEEEEEEFSWEFEQEIYKEPSCDLLEHKYGFANQSSGVFSRLQDEFYEVIDLVDPDKTSIQKRRTLRRNAEFEKFDREHYLADFYDDDRVNELISFVTPWQKEYNRILDKYKEIIPPETIDLINVKGHNAMFSKKATIEFTEDENYTLMKLPNKNYLLSKADEQVAWLGLVDIMFAYCYDYRTTEGEGTSESAWTICKISSVFSWLDSFTSLHEVIRSGYSRCLCYPLYRSWRLVDRVFKDLQILFSLGKRSILRCLLDTRKKLLSDEYRYLLNDLYITDYIVWVQKQKYERISSLSNRLNCEKIVTHEIPFDIKICDRMHAQLSGKDDDDDSGTDETDESSSSETTDSDDIP